MLSGFSSGSASNISADEVTGGPEGGCGLTSDRSGGSAPDSTGKSSEVGEGGYHVLLALGKKDHLATYFIIIKQWS